MTSFCVTGEFRTSTKTQTEKCLFIFIFFKNDSALNFWSTPSIFFWKKTLMRKEKNVKSNKGRLIELCRLPWNDFEGSGGHGGVLLKNGVLRNFSKFTRKQMCQSLFFNNVAGLRHRCFPVNFVKYLRTPFLQNTPGRLLDLLWQGKPATQIN